jgi:hypothetical protein
MPSFYGIRSIIVSKSVYAIYNLNCAIAVMFFLVRSFNDDWQDDHWTSRLGCTMFFVIVAAFCAMIGIHTLTSSFIGTLDHFAKPNSFLKRQILPFLKFIRICLANDQTKFHGQFICAVFMLFNVCMYLKNAKTNAKHLIFYQLISFLVSIFFSTKIVWISEPKVKVVTTEPNALVTEHAYLDVWKEVFSRQNVTLREIAKYKFVFGWSDAIASEVFTNVKISFSEVLKFVPRKIIHLTLTETNSRKEDAEFEFDSNKFLKLYLALPRTIQYLTLDLRSRCFEKNFYNAQILVYMLIKYRFENFISIAADSAVFIATINKEDISPLLEDLDKCDEDSHAKKELIKNLKFYNNGRSSAEELQLLLSRLSGENVNKTNNSDRALEMDFATLPIGRVTLTNAYTHCAKLVNCEDLTLSIKTDSSSLSFLSSFQNLSRLDLRLKKELDIKLTIPPLVEDLSLKINLSSKHVTEVELTGSKLKVFKMECFYVRFVGLHLRFMHNLHTVALTHFDKYDWRDVVLPSSVTSLNLIECHLCDDFCNNLPQSIRNLAIRFQFTCATYSLDCLLSKIKTLTLLEYFAFDSPHIKHNVFTLDYNSFLPPSVHTLKFTHWGIFNLEFLVWWNLRKTNIRRIIIHNVDYTVRKFLMSSFKTIDENCGNVCLAVF